MALRTVTMADLRLEVLSKAEQSGSAVAEICRRYRDLPGDVLPVSTWLSRGGMEGLEDQSRRPKRSPAQIAGELEAEICRMRRTHPRWGARRIHAELQPAGWDPPAVSTIHQALRRNNLVASPPPRRSKALKRFERDVTNDLWQIDATEWRLADATNAYVVDMVDDHSRYLLAAIAAEGPTSEAAWTASKQPRRAMGCLARSSPTTDCVSPAGSMA